MKYHKESHNRDSTTLSKPSQFKHTDWGMSIKQFTKEYSRNTQHIRKAADLIAYGLRTLTIGAIMSIEGRVVVVSNRTPSVSTPSSAEERRNLPVGGLVSCLRPFLEARGGIWMGWDGKSDGQEGSTTAAVTEVEGIRLASVSLSRDEVEGFYNIFSNRTLWPLFHGFPDKATINHDSYPAYRSVNRKYAASLIDLTQARRPGLGPRLPPLPPWQ